MSAGGRGGRTHFMPVRDSAVRGLVSTETGVCPVPDGGIMGTGEKQGRQGEGARHGRGCAGGAQASLGRGSRGEGGKSGGETQQQTGKQAQPGGPKGQSEEGWRGGGGGGMYPGRSDVWVQQQRISQCVAGMEGGRRPLTCLGSNPLGCRRQPASPRRGRVTARRLMSD